MVKAFIRKTFTEIFNKLYIPKTVSLKQKSDTIISKIRNGGYCGHNVVFWDCDNMIDLMTPYMIHIGDNVTFTGARLLTHDASMNRKLGYSRIGKVFIGNNVFVGKQAIVMPNTRIGNNCIIGAGCVVAKDIPDNSVVIGNPCKIICTYDGYIEKQRKLMLEYPVIDKTPDLILDSDSSDIRLLMSSNDIGFTR